MRIWTLVEHSLTPAGGWIRAESMQVTEKERASTASITEEMTAEARAAGSWIRDDQFGVWRISRVEENPVTRTRTLQMEHVIQALGDRIIPEAVDSAAMGGGDTATCAQAVRKILSYQTDWILGTCEYDHAAPYSFDGGEDLMSALETVLGSLEEPWLEFDMSRYPFILHIRRAAGGAACEMRLSRNIVSMRRTIDTGKMFTRFYPVGKEDIRLPGAGYMSRNEGIYGIIEKSQTDQSREDEAALRAWADEQLRKHAQPTVTVSISGIELADATGEPLDRLTVGRICRIPLPEFSATVEERIIQKSWPDVIARPEDVTVTMGSEIADVAQIIRQEVTGSTSTAARGGRAGAKKAKEDHAWFVDDEEHVAMVAEAILGKDESGEVNWSRVAELSVDGKGIHGHVTETEKGLVTHEARIEATERSITQEVIDRSRQAETLSAQIKVEAGKISQIVRSVGSDGKVTAASIIASVNAGSSRIQLKADHIDIDGLIESLEAKDVMFRHFNAYDGEFTSDLSVLGDITAAGDLEATSLSANGYPINVSDAYLRGSTLVIEKTDGTTINFSRATSLSGAWSGGRYTATASPGGSSISTEVFKGTGGFEYWDGNTYHGTIVYLLPDGQHYASTGRSIIIDAQSIYDNGHSDGEEGVTVDSVRAPVRTAEVNFLVTATASNGKTRATRYYLYESTTYVYVLQGTSTYDTDHIVARIRKS